MALLDGLAQLWKLARKVEELLELQSKTRLALDAIDCRLRAIEDRMTHIEAGRDHLITEASAAASAAAIGVASSIISDVVTRVTRVEMRQEALLAVGRPAGDSHDIPLNRLTPPT